MSSIGYIRHEMYNNESCKSFTTTKLKKNKKRKKKSKQAAEVKLRLKILKFFLPEQKRSNENISIWALSFMLRKYIEA